MDTSSSSPFLKQRNLQNLEEEFRDKLPNECWANIISFLPRLCRQSLAQLHGFKELIDGKLSRPDFKFFSENFFFADTLTVENRRLYFGLKNGKLQWSKVIVKNIQPRLRHGTINFNDQLIIFGGASGYSPG